MKQVVIQIRNFDFDSFAKNILAFLEGQVSGDVHPSYAVVRVAKSGAVPEYGPEKGRSEFVDEIENGKLLFFPFSSSNAGDAIECVDGISRVLPDDSALILGDVDCVGFLIGLKEGYFTIDSAIHAGGASPGPLPSIDIVDCDIFDSPMDNYIKQFLAKS
jgi:hypothetical protein